MGRILAATDFSEPSLRAARWAARHLATDDGMVLVHVIDLPQPPSFLRVLLPTSQELRETLQHGATSRMQDLAASLPCPVTVDIREGSAPAAIAAAARDHDAALVVIGEHGTRKGVRGLLGTTAERLLGVSPASVLVTRDTPDAPPASVLAPLDGSPIDAGVLAWCRTLHHHFGARITACHAVDVLDAYGRIRTLSAALRARELEHEMLRNARLWIQERLGEAGVPADAAAAEIMVGDPRHTIPAIAQRTQTDLIVMGARGAGALERAVLGSVTTSILTQTSYSVLVVVEGSSPRGSAAAGRAPTA